MNNLNNDVIDRSLIQAAIDESLRDQKKPNPVTVVPVQMVANEVLKGKAEKEEKPSKSLSPSKDTGKSIKVVDKNVIVQPGDGHCLYHCFAHRIERLGDGMQLNIETLRQIAADYCRTNYATNKVLSSLIDEAIVTQNEEADKALKEGKENLIAGINMQLDDIKKLVTPELKKNYAALINNPDDTAIAEKIKKNFESQLSKLNNQADKDAMNELQKQIKAFPAEMQKLNAEHQKKKIDTSNQETAFKEYFKRTESMPEAGKPGYWASMPEIYALSQEFKLDVTVSRSVGGKRTILPIESSGIERIKDPAGSIHLDFKGIGHYDLYGG